MMAFILSWRASINIDAAMVKNWPGGRRWTSQIM
jgi:hypothetical protein